jgi:hypothetical protein
MGDTPERIWAQDADPEHCDYEGGGWWDDECGSVQYTHMIEYIRADILEAKDAEIAGLRKALVWIKENPHAHPSNMVAAARAALTDDTPGKKG